MQCLLTEEAEVLQVPASPDSTPPALLIVYTDQTKAFFQQILSQHTPLVPLGSLAPVNKLQGCWAAGRDLLTAVMHRHARSNSTSNFKIEHLWCDFHTLLVTFPSFAEWGAHLCARCGEVLLSRAALQLLATHSPQRCPAQQGLLLPAATFCLGFLTEKLESQHHRAPACRANSGWAIEMYSTDYSRFT